MDEQKIVWIYEKLFDSITDLFLGTMFEVYDESEEDDFGDSFIEIYGSVSNAVLIILNNMPEDKIEIVLSKYSKMWIEKGKPKTRFNLRSISNDYSKVLNIVEDMNKNNLMVP